MDSSRKPPVAVEVTFKTPEVPSGIKIAVLEVKDLIQKGWGDLMYDPETERFIMHLRLDQPLIPIQNGFLRGLDEVWLETVPRPWEKEEIKYG